MKKIMLVKIAWMKYYEGRANIDIPMSGAKYIKENKKGGEIYNFKDTGGNVYGNIPFNWQININNLGASNDDSEIKNVTVVFCATHPKEGLMRVVGWYEKATVYRKPEKLNSRNYYHIVTRFKNCTLIPFTDRTLKIPNVFGRNSVCYIATHKSKTAALKLIEDYIAAGGKNLIKIVSKPKGKGRAFQPDIEKRQLVESNAINIAKEYFGQRYGKNAVKSVEKDNMGWDLEVDAEKIKLKIEVKGLSGSELFVQLTPNEFIAFCKKSVHYRLFVVTDALANKPVSRIFEYQSKGDLWVANDKSKLRIEIIKSARLYG